MSARTTATIAATRHWQVPPAEQVTTVVSRMS